MSEALESASAGGVNGEDMKEEKVTLVVTDPAGAVVRERKDLQPGIQLVQWNLRHAPLSRKKSRTPSKARSKVPSSIRVVAG